MKGDAIMIKAIWIAISLTIYTTTMTVDYTADGYSVLIDSEGGEWEYEEEVPGEEVTVILHNNGTPDIEDDVIIQVSPLIQL